METALQLARQVASFKDLGGDLLVVRRVGLGRVGLASLAAVSLEGKSEKLSSSRTPAPVMTAVCQRLHDRFQGDIFATALLPGREPSRPAPPG